MQPNDFQVALNILITGYVNHTGPSNAQENLAVVISKMNDAIDNWSESKTEDETKAV